MMREMSFTMSEVTSSYVWSYSILRPLRCPRVCPKKKKRHRQTTVTREGWITVLDQPESQSGELVSTPPPFRPPAPSIGNNYLSFVIITRIVIPFDIIVIM